MLSEAPLYQELSRWIQGSLPQVRRTTQKRLVWLVAGILLAQSIVLSKIALAQASRGGDSFNGASHERRLRRIENDPRVNWRDTYAPMVRRLLHWKPSHPVYLLIDESGHTDQFRLLVAAVWYRGRAIPLAWVQRPFALDGPVTYWELVRTLLDQVAWLMPAHVAVIVLADRAFGNPAFTDLVEANGWSWVVRLQYQTCYRDRQGRRWNLRQLGLQPGQRWKGRGEIFRKGGWRSASVVGYWDRAHREPLWVASNQPQRWPLIQWYLRRGAIECLFRDWKSAGWQWEASQVRGTAHRECVVLGMAWATLVTLCAGQQVAEEILATPPASRRTCLYLGQRSLFTWGRARLAAGWSSAARSVAPWRLGDFDAPDWHTQMSQLSIQVRAWA